MIIKAVSLFLIAMLVLGMFGKFRVTRPRKKTTKCPECGRHVLGNGPCGCGHKGRRG